MVATRSVASDPIVRFIADALRYYMEFHARYDGFYGAFIHDPLAVAAALDRSLVTTEALFVDVETSGRADDRDDRRGSATDHGPGRRTRTSPSPPTPTTFLDRLIDRVGGLAADAGRACHANRMDWLTICPDGATTPCVAPVQAAYLLALLAGIVLLAHRRASVARLHDRDAEPHGRRDRDQHHRRLADGAPAAAALPGLGRDRARRRAGRTVGRRPDRAAVQPRLVAAPDPRRRRTGDGVLRPGRRDGRPARGLLGEPRRLRPSLGRRPHRRVPRHRVRDRGGRHRDARRPGDRRSRVRSRRTRHRRSGSPRSGSRSWPSGVVAAWLSRRTIFRLRGDDPRIRGYLIGGDDHRGRGPGLRAGPAAVRARPATSRRRPRSRRTGRATRSWAST